MKKITTCNNESCTKKGNCYRFDAKAEITNNANNNSTNNANNNSTNSTVDCPHYWDKTHRPKKQIR